MAIHKFKIVSTLEQIMGQSEGTPVISHLTTCLSAAVPLWILQLKQKEGPDDTDYEWLKNLDGSDLCLRMEYLIHRGPKPGDTTRVFNDTARMIAIMSFLPNGICCFGQRWESFAGTVVKDYTGRKVELKPAD